MSATVPVRPELVEGRSLCEHLSLIAAAPSGIKKLRELILELAVRGKLVPQDPNDEPASELLKRIETENALLVREKIKKKRPLAEIRQDEKLFDIPSGWKWVRFYNVTLSRLGKMLDKTKNRGELKPYLRNTNVQWCHFDLDDVKLMRIEDSERKEFSARSGDLLICEGGEPGSVQFGRVRLRKFISRKRFTEYAHCVELLRSICKSVCRSTLRAMRLSGI